MRLSPDQLPVIVGVGEITHRSKDPDRGLEPLALMEQALRAAERDAGAPILAELDSLDVVNEHSWPYRDAPALLAARLGVNPGRLTYGDAGGESPVCFIHDAALRIACAELRVAAVVGAESLYSVSAAERLGVELPWSPRDKEAKLTRGIHYLPTVAVRLGVAQPTTVYPFYENASQAHWGQTPREALHESAQLWSRFSAVAATNPHAWLREAKTPDDIATPSDINRLIAWPYTKYMVANPLVNMGAAVLMTSLAHARELGIPEERLVHIWGGAAAKEPRDYLQRDQYYRSYAQDVVLESVLAMVGGDAAAFTMLELYSCFPVVPKMARRTLGLPASAPMTSTGGLSFFGAPLNNYMSHAAAGLVHTLRKAPRGKTTLLYGQGQYVTKHHAIVLGSQPPTACLLTPDYSVQAAADARRGPVPELLLDYTGKAHVETFTVIYGRGNQVDHGVVILRTPAGQRLMARVERDDLATLAVLTDLDHSAVKRNGNVTRTDNELLRWSINP